MCDQLPKNLDHSFDISSYRIVDQMVLSAALDAHGPAISVVLMNVLGCDACARGLLIRSLMASCAKKRSLPGFQPCFSDALHLACEQCTDAQRPKALKLMGTLLMRTEAVVAEEKVLQ